MLERCPFDQNVGTSVAKWGGRGQKKGTSQLPELLESAE